MNGDTINQIATAIRRGGPNVFFTGAGISTGSGIPDYRSQGGLWNRYQPVYFDDFMTDRAARIEYWRRKTDLYPRLVQARPNPAHEAIARLHDRGLLRAVITQNIDGLHQAAGLPDEAVVELHGNTLRVRCMSCGRLSSLEAAHQRIADGDPAPECDCGGYLKPDTISFGQAMPQAATDRAASLAGSCDFFCVVGSTLLVQPAAHMPVIAKENGAFLAIINLSETPCDAMSDVRIAGPAETILPAVLASIEAMD